MPEPELDPLDPSLGQDNPARPRDPATGQFVASLPEHPSYLVDQARAFGIGDDEISETPTSALTNQVLRLFQLQQGQRRQPLAAPVEPAAPKKPPTLAALKGKLQLDDEFTAYLEDLETRASKSDKAAERAEKLEQAWVQQSQNQAARDLARGTKTLDAAFAKLASLDPFYEKFFGKEPASFFANKLEDPRWQRRLGALRDEGLSPQDADVHSIRQLKQRADLYRVEEAPASPYEQTPKAKNGRAIDREDWDRAAVARPSQRGGARELPEPEEDRTRQATINLEKRMRTNGQFGGPQQQATDKDILDGFPD